MSARRRAEWREVDFEGWFEANPVLPDGERLLIVGGHEPIRRVVDITAIDASGGLVVLEVKNERAHRTAIGQALEYLAHLEDVVLEDIADDFADHTGRKLGVEFKALYGKAPPPLSARRRVYLVAPSHDSYAAVCASYLSRSLAEGSVEFGLLAAAKVGDGFVLSKPELPRFKRPTAMAEAFGISPGGRLFYVLDAGHPSVVWSIGKWRLADSALRVSRGPSLTAMRYHRRLILPLSAPPQVDLSMAGTSWRHRTKAGRQAVVIGTARPGGPTARGQATVAFAQFRRGSFQTFRRRPEGELHKDWVPSDDDAPQWRQLVEAARTERSRRETSERRRPR